MRNLLEHFKGRLIQKSSIKGKAWEAMMKKLSKFPENSYQTYTLIDQEKIFTNLFGQLSNLAKQCKKGSTKGRTQMTSLISGCKSARSD